MIYSVKFFAVERTSRDAGGWIDTLVAETEFVGKTRDEACLSAQKYMETYPGVSRAEVSDDKTVSVISRATEWQKRNG